MSEAAIGSLTVRQVEVDADWRPVRPYDWTLSAVSWETRSLAALPALAAVESPATLIRFESHDSSIDEIKDRHEAKQVAARAPSKLKLRKSVDVAANSIALEEWLRDRYMEIGRPLRLLVDMTCVPKTYLLFLVGLGFTRDYVAWMDFIYHGGKYDLASEDEQQACQLGGPRSLTSEGEWRSHQIPYLESQEFLPGERDLLVTLGGEIGLSLPFIERFEPRRLGLVFISETAPSDDLPMLQSERSALDDLLREPNAERRDIPLGDVIGVARHAATFAQQARSGAVTGMAIGSKTHALGLAIAALSARNMEVVCRTPSSYKPLDVAPSGRAFVIQVEDRFDPSSYI